MFSSQVSELYSSVAFSFWRNIQTDFHRMALYQASQNYSIVGQMVSKTHPLTVDMLATDSCQDSENHSLLLLPLIGFPYANEWPHIHMYLVRTNCICGTTKENTIKGMKLVGIKEMQAKWEQVWSYFILYPYEILKNKENILNNC